MQPVLLTFFEPFGGRAQNISGLVAGHLSEELVRKAALPVSYRKAFEVLKGHIHQVKPSAVVLLGEALGSPKMRLERHAHNWAHSRWADNEGVIHWDQPLEPGGEACLVTSAPLMKLLPEAEGVEVSLTAGSYVCNQVYYQALRDYSKELACLFIHVTDQQTVEDQATWVRSVLLKLTLSE